MHITHHLILGLIISILFYPIVGLNFVIIFLASTVIDIDHYLSYIIRFKNWDYTTAYRYHMDRHNDYIKSKGTLKQGKTLCFFHTMEVLGIFFIAAFYSNFILLISLGLLIHIIFDILSYTSFYFRNGFGWYGRRISLIFDF